MAVVLPMGIVFNGAPKALLRELHARFRPGTFIETGTFRGETTEWASRLFAQVYSVEAQPEMHKSTAARLNENGNIHLECGDTRSFLRKLVPQLTGPAVFWLDAHWCGSTETHGATDECPILQELAIIAASPHAHFIFIDDARLFLSPPAAPHDYRAWPTIRDLMHAPCACEERYHTVIADDIIMTVPTEAGEWLVEYIRGLAFERQHTRLLEEGAVLATRGVRQMYWGLRQKAAKNLRRFWR